MDIILHNIGTNYIAEIISDRIEINHAQDALELMANCAYQGAAAVVLRNSHLAPAFFDLKTGLAGDILQKFSNYSMRLAIAGDFSIYPGKSLGDFIYESNKGGRVLFVGSVSEGLEKLASGL